MKENFNFYMKYNSEQKILNSWSGKKLHHEGEEGFTSSVLWKFFPSLVKSLPVPYPSC